MKNKLMKILIIFICFIILISSTVFAVGETVIKVDGPKTIKKGDKIEYKISVKDVNRLYAGSIDIKFNNENIIIKEIKASDFIKKDGIDKMEFGGGPNLDNNKISYQFTCVGEVNGYSGEGVIATFVAEGVEDCEVNLDDSLDILLCERTEDNDIVEIKYSYMKTNIMSGISSEEVSKKADIKNSDLSNGASVDNGNKEKLENSVEKDILQEPKSGSFLREVLEKESMDSNVENKESEEETMTSSEGGKGSSVLLFVLLSAGMGVTVMGTIVYRRIWRKKK